MSGYLQDSTQNQIPAIQTTLHIENCQSPSEYPNRIRLIYQKFCLNFRGEKKKKKILWYLEFTWSNFSKFQNLEIDLLKMTIYLKR